MFRIAKTPHYSIEFLGADRKEIRAHVRFTMPHLKLRNHRTQTAAEKVRDVLISHGYIARVYEAYAMYL